mmetsp:Transcript_52905/g.158376  ORF Transcript_52905/g.158376 Transcript_52905/m.158376 type:complete len:92 (+) Transcript_52905:1269-1544(+)
MHQSDSGNGRAEGNGEVEKLTRPERVSGKGRMDRGGHVRLSLHFSWYDCEYLYSFVQRFFGLNELSQLKFTLPRSDGPRCLLPPMGVLHLG